MYDDLLPNKFLKLKLKKVQFCLCGYEILWPATCRKTSSKSRNKSQSLNLSCILLQLSSLNPLKPGVKLRMKM